MHRSRAFILAVVLMVLAACGEDPSQPYVAFDGGGFVFNYRSARAFYEFNLRPMRGMQPGTILEAEFENPAGAPPFIVTERVREGKLRYRFMSPSLTGIQQGRPYRAMVRVKRADGTLLASYERSFVSSASQDALPNAPPFIGPGYNQRNPDSEYLPKDEKISATSSVTRLMAVDEKLTEYLNAAATDSS